MEKTHISKWIILPVLLLLLGNGAKAQVTIGSNKIPAFYEKLRIEGNGQSGLRLARISQEERNILESKMIESQGGGTTVWKSSAKGLVIYNLTSNAIEFWNGKEWLQLEASMSFINGLHLDNKVSKLGGTLSKNTTIDQLGKDLSLNIKTGGELSVGEGTLVATNANLMVGNATTPAIFSVRSQTDVELLSITNTNKVTIAADKAASFTVNTDVLSIDNSKIAIPVGKGFQYVDGNEGIDTGLSNLILTSDVNGNANWKKLEATTSTMSIPLLPRTNQQLFPRNTWTPLTSEITLTKGKWLIMGRYTTYTGYSTNEATGTYANYLGMLRLFGMNGNEAENLGAVYVAATIPEKKNSGTGIQLENKSSYASPTMVTYMDITTDTPQRFTIDFYTSKSQTWLPYNSGWMGQPYFQAIRISGI